MSYLYSFWPMTVRLMEIIREELAAIKQEYADPRRTEIIQKPARLVRRRPDYRRRHGRDDVP